MEFGSCNVNRKTIYPLLDNRMVKPIHAYICIFIHINTHAGEIRFRMGVRGSEERGQHIHTHIHTHMQTSVCITYFFFFIFLKPIWSIKEYSDIYIVGGQAVIFNIFYSLHLSSRLPLLLV